MKRRTTPFVLLVLLSLSLSSCAPSGFTEEPSSFFGGLWHGLIIFFSTLGKLFNFDVGIYASHNNGWPYWLGFLIGLSVAIGGSSKASHKVKRN